MSDRPQLAPVPNLRKDSIPAPKRRAKRYATNEQPEPSHQQPSSTEEKQDTNTRGSDRKRTAKDGPDTKPISLSVPAPLVKELKVLARTTERSQADVLLDAIVAHRDQLTDLVAERKRQTIDDGLFMREVPQPQTDPLIT